MTLQLFTMAVVCWFSNIYVYKVYKYLQIWIFPPKDAVEYAEVEATVKSHWPFIEAMKRRGIYDMELVMVDAW